MAETIAPPDASRKNALSGFINNLVTELPNPSITPPPPKEADGTPAVQPDPNAPKPGVPPATPVAAAPAADKAGQAAPTDEKPPRDSAAWKAFKDARDKSIAERETKIKELETQLAAAAAKVPPPVTELPEYQGLKKERDELDERLKLVEVTQHPKFQKYFNSKKESQMQLAKQIVGDARADQVAKLLELPDGDFKRAQLNEFVAELSPLESSQLGGVLNNLTSLENERQSEIKKARENYDQLQASQKTQAEANRAATDRAIAGVIEKAQKENPAYQVREGDENWNKAVASRIDQFRNFFSGKADPSTLFQTVLNGTAFDALASQAQSLLQENQKLQEQVKALSSAQPKVETGGTRTETTDAPPKLNYAPGSTPRQVMGAWTKALPQQ